MTVPRDLDFDKLEGVDHTPSVKFSVGGREWHCKAAGDLPLNLMEPALREGSLHVQIGTFFEGVLVANEVEDFLTMLNDPRSPITMANGFPLMQKVTEYLVKKRPTKRPVSSQAGPRSTKRRSGAVSSSRATPKRK